MLRTMVAALVVLVLVAGGALVDAVRSRGRALDEQGLAASQRDLAASRAAAATSDRVVLTDDAVAQRIALAGYVVSPTLEARSAVLDRATSGVIGRIAGEPGPTAAALRPDGQVLAVSGARSGTVRLYRVAAGGAAPLVGTVAADAVNGQVFALAFDRSGTRLAMGTDVGRVRVVDVSDPAHPGTATVLAPSLGQAVQSVAFSADGGALWATGRAPAVRYFELGAGGGTVDPPTAGTATGDLGAVTVSELDGYGARLSPDGSLVAWGGSDGVVRLQSASDPAAPPRVVQVSAAGSAVVALAFAPDGRSLLTGTRDSRLRIVDVAGGTVGPLLGGGITSGVGAVAWSADGRRIVAGGSDSQVVVLNPSGAVLGRSPATANVTALGFLDSGGTRLFSASSDGTVLLRQAVTRLPVDGTVYAVTWPEPDRLGALWTGGSGGGRIWTVGRDDLPDTPTYTVPRPESIGRVDGTGALARGGEVLAVGGGAGPVLLCRGVGTTPTSALPAAGGTADTTGCQVLTGAGGLIESVALAPDAQEVAAGSDDGYVHRWDVSDPTAPRALTPLATHDYAMSVTYGDDGTLAAASADGHVYRWVSDDRGVATALPVLGGFEGYAWSVAFAPGSSLLAAGGADDTVRIWDVSDASNPRLVAGPLTGPAKYVFGLSWTPDGTRLSAAAGDGTVWTWAVSPSGTATPWATLRAADVGGGTYSLAYAPDGSRLLAGGTDPRLTLWPTDPDAVRAALCATGSAQLDEQEWARYLPDAPYRPVCS